MVQLLQLEKRLKGVILKNRIIIFGAGVVATISTIIGLGLLLSAIAVVIILPVYLKLFLMATAGGLLFFAIYRYVYKPVKKGGDLISAALMIEKKYPDLKNRLVAALQFRDLNLEKTNFSPTLIDMTGKQALELTREINFNEIVSGYPLFRKLRSGTVVAVVATLVAIIMPGIFSNALDVYSHPTIRVAPPSGFSVTVQPGNAEKVKYSDIEIGGQLIGGRFPKELEIFYKFAEGRWQSEKIPVANSYNFSVNGNGNFHVDTLPFGITLKQVRRSFDYYIVAGEVTSEKYAINIVEKPRVSNLKLTIRSPRYTGLADLIADENNGSFAALVGSRSYLEIEANRNIESGYLIRDDSVKLPIDFEKSIGKINFIIQNDFSYHLRLYDKNGETNPDPIEYMVTAIPDEYPYIKVNYPAYDINFDDRMMIPFDLYISDDFGFGSLVMKYQIITGGRQGEENVAVINFSDDISTEGEVTFNWDVDRFNLLPSDLILYHFEISDNDVISGPKTTSTRVYAARLPSIDEIIAETDAQQETRIFKAEKILQEQRKMADQLKELAREMKSAKKIDWKKSRELENMVKQQNLTAENIEKMAEHMEESIKQMEQNNLLSEQIMQKMMELQKLFNEIATPEMKEAMRKLAEALKNMSPEEIEQAMKEFQVSQEEMLKRLERSVELLKRMQIEQKMAAMLKMAEEMLLEQNRVNVETQQLKSDDEYPRLSRREDKLQKQMEALKNEADKLKDLIEKSELQNAELQNSFADAVKDNQAGSDMNQMEQELNNKNANQAKPHGEEASRKLSGLVGKLQETMAAFADEEGRKLAQEMLNAINDANYLSQKQEDIYEAIKNGSAQTDYLRKMAAEQMTLRESVNSLIQRVNELSKKSPFLAAETRSFLEQSRQNMQSSCDNLGERRTSAAYDSQQEAMYNLNRASVKLLDGLEEQNDCNKGGSCNKNNQKMQSMCQKQNEINQQTQQECNNPGKNPNATRQALKRLAGEQGTVRKSLEELQKEFGNRRDILGRLDALSDEIKEIEGLLEEGQAGQELVDRQLRVYSRMLDVQKSLNRRDFTKERQSVIGKDILRASPGALDDDNMVGPETLQDRLNQYLKEGYPRQYEQQIKAYFKALSGMRHQADENK
ncbi:MAG: hypothetical protein V3V99_14820 [candidate division Zixibacteria bacterium]